MSGTLKQADIVPPSETLEEWEVPAPIGPCILRVAKSTGTVAVAHYNRWELEEASHRTEQDFRIAVRQVRPRQKVCADHLQAVPTRFIRSKR